MALFLIAGCILLYQGILHDGKRLIDDALYLATLPVQLIARAGDAIARWHRRTDPWNDHANHD